MNNKQVAGPLIRFFTFMQRDEGRPFTETAANHANATVVLPTFHVRCDRKDRLSSHYVMTFADGIINTHVIRLPAASQGPLHTALGSWTSMPSIRLWTCNSVSFALLRGE